MKVFNLGFFSLFVFFFYTMLFCDTPLVFSVAEV